MQPDIAPRAQRQLLFFGPKTGRLNVHRVLADGNLVENKFPGVVAVDCLFERGTHRAQLDDRAAYRAMLRIVNQAADRTENRSDGEWGEQQKTKGEKRRRGGRQA